MKKRKKKSHSAVIDKHGQFRVVSGTEEESEAELQSITKRNRRRQQKRRDETNS